MFSVAANARWAGCTQPTSSALIGMHRREFPQRILSAICDSRDMWRATIDGCSENENCSSLVAALYAPRCTQESLSSRNVSTSHTKPPSAAVNSTQIMRRGATANDKQVRQTSFALLRRLINYALGCIPRCILLNCEWICRENNPLCAKTGARGWIHMAFNYKVKLLPVQLRGAFYCSTVMNFSDRFPPCFSSWTWKASEREYHNSSSKLGHWLELYRAWHWKSWSCIHYAVTWQFMHEAQIGGDPFPAALVVTA